MAQHSLICGLRVFGSKLAFDVSVFGWAGRSSIEQVDSRDDFAKSLLPSGVHLLRWTRKLLAKVGALKGFTLDERGASNRSDSISLRKVNLTEICVTLWVFVITRSEVRINLSKLVVEDCAGNVSLDNVELTERAFKVACGTFNSTAEWLQRFGVASLLSHT